MIDEKWYKFMQAGDYKKYQIDDDRNKPYLDNFQRGLMEKYQLRYFRSHPLEDEFNHQGPKMIWKINN